MNRLAWFLAYTVTLFVFGSPVVAQNMDRCTDLFGRAPEFQLCDATTETCSFNARTNGGTCAEMCASLGSYCAAAQSNDGPDRCVDSGNPDTCTTPRGTEICTCARPVVEPPLPPSCADLFGRAPEFELCDGSDTTCSFNVRTNNERTCREVCEAVEGATCAGAIDNVGSSCIERPPGESAEPDSCDSQQDTSICVCNRPQVEPTHTTVFVTSKTFTGNLGGLAGADEKCQDLADAADLTGRFTAWLSTEAEDAKDRIPVEGPYQRVDGVLIAEDLDGLIDGSINASIDVDENEIVVSVNRIVWTGTNVMGMLTNSGDDCDGWRIGMGVNFGGNGQANQTSGRWTVLGSIACGGEGRLYCFGR